MSGLSSYLFSTLSKVGGIGGTGIPDFHYTLGEKVEAYSGQSIWQLYHGQKNDGSKQEASIFVFDKTRGSSYTAVAQNAHKRMRALRHPGILRYFEGSETAEALYIATEPVVPLSLEEIGEEELRRWGLYKIAETLKFVGDDCKLVHANLSTASVFVTRAGEWKLGGLELVGAHTGDGGMQAYRNYSSVIPGYAARMAPEFEAQKWNDVEKGKPGAVDGWSLACLVYQVFNGELRSTSQLSAQGQIPKALWPLYQRLLVPDLARRMTPGEFLDAASRPGSYLDSDFVRASMFLENIAVKDEDEKTAFLSSLHSMLAGFPHTFAKYKILPELLKIMEFGGGDAKVLSGIIQIGKSLEEAEYAELVVPAIVQLFGSNDRALRFSLLEHMNSFISAVPAAVVSKQVFPNFLTGFLDAAPAIREATVKATLAMAPKLSSKTLNNDLIRQLVRLVGDPEPGIRTNTLICIGKLCTAKEGVLDLDSGGINESSHRYIVCPALLHALRDPFPPVRSAALAVACACVSRWDAVETARRVIPAVAPLLVDSEKPVRVAAMRAVQAMVSRVDTHAQTMPASTAPPKTAGEANVAAAASSAAAAAVGKTPVADMAATASGWGGWAVSSLSNTLGGALSLAANAAAASPGTTASQQQPLQSTEATTGFKNPLPSASPTATSRVAEPVVPLSSKATEKAAPSNSASDGWGFEESGWGDDADDAWGANDDAWDDADLDTNKPTTLQPPLIPSAPAARSTTTSQAASSGGMVMSNTANMAFGSVQLAAPTAVPHNSKPAIKSPIPRITKPSKKLETSSTTPASNTATSVGSRRKGLGAMKLGGAKKPPAILDEEFF